MAAKLIKKPGSSGDEQIVKLFKINDLACPYWRTGAVRRSVKAMQTIESGRFRFVYWDTAEFAFFWGEGVGAQKMLPKLAGWFSSDGCPVTAHDFIVEPLHSHCAPAEGYLLQIAFSEVWVKLRAVDSQVPREELAAQRPRNLSRRLLRLRQHRVIGRVDSFKH